MQEGLGCEILELNRLLNFFAISQHHYFVSFIIRGAQLAYANPFTAFHKGKNSAQRCKENCEKQEMRDSLQMYEVFRLFLNIAAIL